MRRNRVTESRAARVREIFPLQLPTVQGDGESLCMSGLKPARQKVVSPSSSGLNQACRKVVSLTTLSLNRTQEWVREVDSLRQALSGVPKGYSEPDWGRIDPSVGGIESL